MTILVTGGAGFIGSNLVLQCIAEDNASIINLDKLTGNGNLNNLSHLEHHQSHQFIRGDIRNRSLIHETLRKYRPQSIINCAAETHIEKNESCIQTNINGTFEFLEETLAYWKQLDSEEQKRFRFLHLSTDEVYGLAEPNSIPVTEISPCKPHRLYAASRAAAEQIVQTYNYSYGLPTLIARSPSNFGPYQFPEKLIPLTIVNALQGKSLPIHGSGMNTRNWLYVGDNCSALRHILTKGNPGEIYNIGDQEEITNKDLVTMIYSILDEFNPDSLHTPHANLIKFVKERSTADRRFRLDSSKLIDLGWQPKENFEDSLRKTISWYLNNMPWVEHVISGEYRDLISADFSVIS